MDVAISLLVTISALLGLIQPGPADRGADSSVDAEQRRGLGEIVAFPAVGTRVRKPHGFVKSKDFHGFQNVETQSSILIVVIPGPFQEITAGFDADGLKSRGMALLSKQDTTVSDLSGLLVHVEQESMGTAFRKWMLIFGDEESTRMILATFPKRHETDLGPLLREAVKSASPIQIDQSGLQDEVGFTIKPSAKLVEAQSIGKMRAFSKDGSLTSESPADPLFVVGKSLGVAVVEDRQGFAIQRLFQTAQTKISSIVSHEEIERGALKGFEHVAVGEDSDSGIPLTVYQAILFDSDGYFLMTGLVGKDLADTYLPEFKKMSRSFARKRD